MRSRSRNARGGRSAARLGSSAEVTISVVDLKGDILGLVRTPDAPVFGIDVAVQKARSAMFFSSPDAAALLASVPPAQYLSNLGSTSISGYVDRMRAFLGDPAALTGNIAWSARAIGNIHRPFFPDGIDGTPPGPLSTPIASWSPFNVGFQLDLFLQPVREGRAGRYVARMRGAPAGGRDTGRRRRGHPATSQRRADLPGLGPHLSRQQARRSDRRVRRWRGPGRHGLVPRPRQRREGPGHGPRRMRPRACAPTRSLPWARDFATCSARRRRSTTRRTRMSARAFSLVMLCALPAFAQDKPYPPEPNRDEEIVPRRAGPSEPERYFPPPVDPGQVPQPAAFAAARDAARARSLAHHAGPRHEVPVVRPVQPERAERRPSAGRRSLGPASISRISRNAWAATGS